MDQTVMTKSSGRRAVACQPLEARRLLALSVIGSAATDVIRIARDGEQVLIVNNGVESRYGNVDAIVVAGGGGGDTIRIDDAGGVAVTIRGEAGDDRIEVGAGDVAAARLASVSVVGGTGIDTLVIDDAASTAGRAGIVIDNPFDVAMSVALPASLGVIWADASNATDTIEALLLRGSGGDDAIVVRGAHARVATTLDVGGGNDALTFDGDVDSKLRGPLVVDGGIGTNYLTVDDSADSFADTYFLEGAGNVGTLRKNSGGATITYANLNGLTLHAGVAGSFPNNQQFRATYVPDQTSTTIFAGSGDDALFFGDGVRGLDDFHAGVVFAGQDGMDRIAYNDALGSDAATYEVSPIFITNPGTGSIVYFECEAISLRANDAANLLRLTATVGTVNVTLHGGGGDDRFEVGNGDLDASVADSVSVVGGAGDDSLAIDDGSDDAGDDAYHLSAGLLLRTLKAVLWSSDGDALTESVSLAGSPNADVIRISSASPNVALSVDAGAGDDAIHVDRTAGRGAADTVTAAVSVTSGAGGDTLDVNADDSGSDALAVLTSPLEELDELHVRAGGRLHISGGASAVVRVGGAFGVGGVLDLGAATLVAAAADVAAITQLVVESRVISSAALATIAGDAVAVASAAAVGLPVFNGVATIAGDVVLRYTLGGDANLDRVVDFDDLLAFAQHYGGVGRLWSDGNFTYDAAGAIDFDDLLLLAQNYGLSVA